MSSTTARRGQAGPGNVLKMLPFHQQQAVPPTPKKVGAGILYSPTLHQLGPGCFPPHQRGISGILG